MSFNNRNAADTIPFLSPLIAPSARFLGPALNMVAASPVRSTVEVRIRKKRGMACVEDMKSRDLLQFESTCDCGAVVALWESCKKGITAAGCLMPRISTYAQLR
jgi:hypothetical protein